MLEELAKKGYFPEIKDLPKLEVPKVMFQKLIMLKLGSKKKIIKNKINYDLKILKKSLKFL